MESKLYITIESHEISMIDYYGNTDRITFEYGKTEEKCNPLNKCDLEVCNLARQFSYDFFTLSGIFSECFKERTHIQTYKFASGRYNTPFNGKTGMPFSDDLEHAKGLTATCGCLNEAVCEINTNDKAAYNKLKKFAKKLPSDKYNVIFK